jgi:nucleosome binding factor SPN SPT16 subunit
LTGSGIAKYRVGVALGCWARTSIVPVESRSATLKLAGAKNATKGNNRLFTILPLNVQLTASLHEPVQSSSETGRSRRYP